ncbi:MAG: hypothetical protein AAF840_01195, partial [Bacteroidota bacterium]
MRTLYSCFFLLAYSVILSAQSISVRLPAGLANQPLDGRLLIMLSTAQEGEPRFQITDGPGTAQVFGMDVEGWRPGTTVQLDQTAVGYPLQQLADLPGGDYRIQVLLHKYETFTRSDGHTVKLPMDRGEGQQWNRAPGNLLSTPKPVTINPGTSLTIDINQSIAPIEPAKDTEWIKHVKIRSERLSKFWGRDMYLGAHVLLPAGWAEHPDVKYPLAIMHGHFPQDFGGFRTSPPDTSQPCEYSSRFGLDCYNHIQEQEAYDFYQAWSGPGFPR